MDYQQITDFSVKDDLPKGDPQKVIRGAEHDAEFAAIAEAIASKFDSDDLASQAQAAAGSLNTVLMTPARVTNWADAQAGIVGDLWRLSDPEADGILFWDSSDEAATFLTLKSGELEFDGTELGVGDNVPLLDAANAFTDTNTFSAGIVTGANNAGYASGSGNQLTMVFTGTDGVITAASGDLQLVSSSGAVRLNGISSAVFARTDQDNTFVNQTISAGVGRLRLTGTNSDTDEGTFDLEVRAGQFRIVTRDDSGTLIHTPFVMNRNGATVDAITLGAPTSISGALTTTGTATINNGLVLTSSTIDATGTSLIIGGTGRLVRLQGGDDENGNPGAAIQITNDAKSVLIRGGGVGGANNAAQFSETNIVMFKPVRAGSVVTSASTTLVAGQVHHIASGVTINTGEAGNWVGIYNNSGSSITLTQGSGLTLRLSGTGLTGNRTLAARGLAVIYWPASSTAVVSGGGVS